MSDGTHTGGAKAVLAVAREIWWAHPLIWLAALPGMMSVLDTAYRWVAARRGCSSEWCEVK
jgi:predicted DCC family thiol-disulfide oxidoreductase YuxK